jgi:predicted AAA+ superfamily ATPase
MKNWKQWLKGIFDTESLPPEIIVTGSAKLDTYKKVGDSLAGRYFQYRLHPLDLRELSNVQNKLSTDEVLERLLNLGGFPEPFLEGTEKFYNIWKKTHLDIILRQDLIDQEDVRDIKSIELLIDLLKRRVASPISYNSLAEDLQKSDKTIKKWLSLLESMDVIFKVTPFHKNVARSNLKRPKYYFYDIARVTAGEGAKLENLVACSLLKECHFRQDCFGEDWKLHYLSKKDGQEVDFLLSKDGVPKIMIEVKKSDSSPSQNLKVFSKDLPDVAKIQLVKVLDREKTFPDGTEIRKITNWLVDW